MSGTDKVIAQLNFGEDGVYIVKNGILKPISSPPSGYGKTVISWEANKPTRAEHQYSEKL